MSDKSSALRAKSNDVREMPMTQPEGLGRRWPDSSLLVSHRATTMLLPRASISANGGSSECAGTCGTGHLKHSLAREDTSDVMERDEEHQRHQGCKTGEMHERFFIGIDRLPTQQLRDDERRTATIERRDR